MNTRPSPNFITTVRVLRVSILGTVIWFSGLASAGAVVVTEEGTPPPPIVVDAHFTADALGGRVVSSGYAAPTGTPIRFSVVTPSSKNSQYMWDFGDGTIENAILQDSHTFAVPGKYIVTLTVTLALSTTTLTSTFQTNLYSTELSHQLLCIGCGTAPPWETSLTLTNPGDRPLDYTISTDPRMGPNTPLCLDVNQCCGITSGTLLPSGTAHIGALGMTCGTTVAPTAVYIATRASDPLPSAAAQASDVTGACARTESLPVIAVSNVFVAGPLFASGFTTADYTHVNVFIVSSPDNSSADNITAIISDARGAELSRQTWLIPPGGTINTTVAGNESTTENIDTGAIRIMSAAGTTRLAAIMSVITKDSTFTVLAAPTVSP